MSLELGGSMLRSRRLIVMVGTSPLVLYLFKLCPQQNGVALDAAATYIRVQFTCEEPIDGRAMVEWSRCSAESRVATSAEILRCRSTLS